MMYICMMLVTIGVIRLHLSLLLQALDRRVRIVLKEIKTCLDNNSHNTTLVIVDDGF